MKNLPRSPLRPDGPVATEKPRTQPPPTPRTTDIYLQKILRHIDLIKAAGQRTAVFAGTHTPDFWQHFLAPEVDRGDVILIGETNRSGPGWLSVEDFLACFDTLRCGAVLLATQDFGHHLRIKKHFAPLQKKEVAVVSVLGYAALPERPVIAWADRGLTYPGIYQVVGNYSQSFKAHQKCYVEFGCFEGRTLSMAYHILAPVGFRKFVAFDSFSGLIGTTDNEKGVYSDGDYSASRASVEHNLQAANCDLGKFTFVEGDIRRTAAKLAAAAPDVAVANIDVDIYEPAKAALNALTDRLVPGAILMFDDFDGMGATNEASERRALTEWLQENPGLAVESFRNYGAFGRAFIVHKGRSAAVQKASLWR